MGSLKKKTMVKLKRASENQITKETFDGSDEDFRLANESDPVEGMIRASADVMKGRKIIKPSR
jgi:hypothetical protein